MSSSCLPDELVIEILSYVAVKPLMRFKCVSKVWYHFISYDSSFAKLHFNRSTNADSRFENSSIIFYDTDNRFFTADCNALDNESTFKELIPLFDKSDYSIIGSYSGLVCLANKMNPKESSDMYIWNPCTRDCISIPLPSLPSDLPPFEDLKQGFGFSYHRESNEYMLVMILSEWDTCSYIFVFTPGKGLWEFYKISYYLVCCNRSNIFVNGALHWIANAPGEEYLIVSLNIKDDVFQEILPPPLRIEDINTIEVCDLNGMLCVTCSERDLHKEEFHIWVMKEYGVDSSWIKQYVFEDLDFPFELEPLYITDDGKLLAKDDSLKKLIMFNTNSNPEHEIFSHSLHQVYPYVRTLASLEFESATEELKLEDHGKQEEKGNI
ncbi:F-box/kelch-repeat protein [Thalictrum thalictroides]|uniref:F-box/kelch-repeat protein n=1 Tax=Thalictrum thalictroides TaxID=46969 RepID=A0A7J6WVZ7_THATH|nr:F-box/kelch-repeat protein [Thalictrum thalictroides]